MTEREAIKLHISENIHKIEVIEDFLSTNSDANDKECRKNIDILTKINKALEKQINSGWIPCSERLPKIYDDTCTSEIVLVQGYDKEIDYDWQAMGWYAEESKQWYFAECKNTDKPINWIDIIAWQPLPKPYQESEETKC